MVPGPKGPFSEFDSDQFDDWREQICGETHRNQVDDMISSFAYMQKCTKSSHTYLAEYLSMPLKSFI